MKALSALKYTAALCLAAAMSGLSVSPKTLFSYEFPKDYTEEQNFSDGFSVKDGFIPVFQAVNSRQSRRLECRFT